MALVCFRTFEIINLSQSRIIIIRIIYISQIDDLKILKLLILKMNNESLPLILFNCNTTTITKFLALGGCVTNCYNNTFSYISTGSYFSRPCANVWQYFKLNAHEGVFHSTTEV